MYLLYNWLQYITIRFPFGQNYKEYTISKICSEKNITISYESFKKWINDIILLFLYQINYQKGLTSI